MREAYTERGLRWALDYDAKRVRPIVAYASRNVLLKDITIRRAGFWTITFTYCDRVHADGVTIRNNIDGHGPSTDGMDIDSSSNVLIERCDIDCNDDNFCLKAGKDFDGLRVNRPTENVVIRNCVTGRGHGLITIGSETSGGVRNCEVYGLKAEGTSQGFRMKSAKVRGGVVRDIWVHDVEMNGVALPFNWELDWFPAFSYPVPPRDIPESEWPAHWRVITTKVEPPERGIPWFHHIRVYDVTVTGAKTAIHANAYPEKPLSDVCFENVHIEAESGGSVENARDWTMTKVTLQAPDRLRLKDCSNVELPGGPPGASR